MNREMSMMRSQMRSNISMISRSRMGGMGRAPPPSTGVMQYVITLIIIFVTLFGVGVGVYFAFLQKSEPETTTAVFTTTTRKTCDDVERFISEKRPLVCSMDGSLPLPFPVELCTHIIFLHAEKTITGVDVPNNLKGQFAAFSRASKAVGKVVKLVSLLYDDVKALSSTDLYNRFDAFLKKNPFLDGMDIRYVPVPNDVAQQDQIAKLVKEMSTSFSKRSEVKLLHVTFDKADGISDTLAKSPGMASVRLYTPLGLQNISLPPNPYKSIRASITKMAALGTSQDPNWSVCAAYTLAVYQYDSTGNVGDKAYNGVKQGYCSPARKAGFQQDDQDKFSYQTREGKLLLYDSVDELSEKVKLLKDLKTPCLMLDDVIFDDATCYCTKTRFYMLSAARRAFRSLENRK